MDQAIFFPHPRSLLKHRLPHGTYLEWFLSGTACWAHGNIDWLREHQGRRYDNTPGTRWPTQWGAPSCFGKAPPVWRSQTYTRGMRCLSQRGAAGFFRKAPSVWRRQEDTPRTGLPSERDLVWALATVLLELNVLTVDVVLNVFMYSCLRIRQCCMNVRYGRILIFKQ